MASTAQRKLSLLLASCLVAAAAFWVVLLSYPPPTEAAGTAIPVMEMMKQAPTSMASGTGDTH